ncbi:hypothetical protein DPMN_116419 [Dreissena polymorpha]|uniref:Uncharacterized protein n=1 Tax=Dreissena polymorpha TaxID=45954 RepID=A0A9D4KN14_DREPO|nr:hypothetical protein DPMN_116419 [Dreissena polymorpha]
MYLLTTLRDEQAECVQERFPDVLKEYGKHCENCPPPPPAGHVIQLTGTIFKLNSHIKETNVLTKFNENWAKMCLLECSHKNAPPTGSHVFSPIWTFLELVRDINKTNAKIVTSRVFTRFLYSQKKENCTPPPGTHVIQLTGTIFELNSHIKETNKNSPPTGGHVFSPVWTIFELVRDFNKTNETNVLTIFHENWAKNVTSIVFTCFHYVHIENNTPPTGGHVFSPIWTIFELVRDINKTNVLTNFHDDWAKIVTSRVFTSHVIELTRTIFELYSHIKQTNVLTKFHENWAKNVLLECSHVFTLYMYREKCPANWRPCFFANLDYVRTRPRYQ